ncbi:MAG TPA: protease pro-enzyme activation domain-containing protein, partial [Steroidobacteraceae bacterium]|nr:protease pro-enzyme activation domain-containing protein [Steroidobacteraceae bacterium]
MKCRSRAAWRPPFLTTLAAVFAAATGPALAAGSSTAIARIVQPINESQLAPVGSVPLLAAPQFDRGAVSDSLPLEHMFVQLRRSSEQESALDGLLAELQNPSSANYHKWLTAQQLGERFGPAQADIDTVVQWLTSHGLRVNVVHQNGLT